MAALFYSSVQVSHDSVTMSQHAQNQEPEPEEAKWSSAVIISLLSLVLSY